MQNIKLQDKLFNFLSSKKLWKKGDINNCTNKEVLILEKLLKNIWNPVTKKELVEYAWWECDSEKCSRLDIYIHKIRKKISKTFIKTIKWKGYQIDKII